MKKFSAIAILVSASLSSAAFAADSHDRYTGSVVNLKDSLVITDAKAAADIAKYTTPAIAAKLAKAYAEDGKLTAAEIKASGISDHHFYTGYLASAKNQSQYDAKLKELNGGSNVDDNFVSNRDMKAHGSMIMNQVGGNMQKAHTYYTGRMDNLASGLEKLGAYVTTGGMLQPDAVGADIPVVLPENQNGAVERPYPGSGSSVDRPMPGQGVTPERPYPGQGVSPERPRPAAQVQLNKGQIVESVKDSDGNVIQGLVRYENTNERGETTTGYKYLQHNAVITDADGNVTKIEGVGYKAEYLNGRLEEAMNGYNPEGGDVERPDSTAPGGLIEDVQNNSNNIASMGEAFENRVDAVNGYLSQAGESIQNNANNIQALGNAFQAQAAHTAAEISRLDGRIDSLEKKTDKMKAGIAGANAIGTLSQYMGSGTHHVAVAVGGYEDANALAGGYTYAYDKNTTLRATIAVDTEGSVGYGVSVGHSW